MRYIKPATILILFFTCSRLFGETVSVLKPEHEYPGNDFAKYASSPFFKDFVSRDEFLKKNDAVNPGVISSIKPADSKPRKEKKISGTVFLRGSLVTPSEIIKDGVIKIEYTSQKYSAKYPDHVYGTITSITPFAELKIPAGAEIIDLTGNYIYPGFIDSHNHVGYNIFNLWKPTYDIYPNRNTWPRDPRYKDWQKLIYYFSKHNNFKIEIQKYSEIKCLLGGGTMLQGYLSNLSGNLGLVRGLENNSNMLGRDTIGQMVLPVNMWWVGKEEASGTKRNKIISSFESGKTNRFLVHFCEGIDDKINEEFEKFVEYDLLREEFIGIHSASLSGDAWTAVAKSGFKIVWSPLSNLILYDRTADIAGALKKGVPLQHIALAPDWAPSGNPNQLFEAKTANEYNIRRLNGLLTPKNILSMITEHPALMIGYDDLLGSISKGRRADFTVIKIKDSDPYKSMLMAGIEDINLVLIDGQPLYGTLSDFKKFDKGNDYETFNMEGITKAIDITEEFVEKGRQTLGELMTFLTGEFENIKKVMPFEFEKDIEAYCRLAPLYWPRQTSYDNIIYESVAGKGSEYDNSEGYRKIGELIDRDRTAVKKYTEFKKSKKAKVAPADQDDAVIIEE